MTIRKANKDDLCRIAEILVFVKRMNYRTIFKNDEYSFNELTVVNEMKEYEPMLDELYVYDDGIVKGVAHIHQNELKTLYVDHFFQNNHIGEALLEFAKKHGVTYLKVLEKNTKAISFYKCHGFEEMGSYDYEDGTTEKLLYFCLKCN